VFGSLGQQNRKAFEMAKKFNIASAIMNTAVGISKAFAMGGPLGFLTAAAVAAAGFAQVAAIRSQQYSGRALGGPVMGNTPYMVGENGPEMFVPATSGSITRNDQLDSESVNVNFTINAIDSRGVDQLLIERKSVITSIITDAMLEKGRRSRF
jgi:SLT domain-containing protein